ncbi:TPX2 domain-containing protein [Abeliophyllum distichum]|uniref:TPX2 domain-containing protein n=1 Tax=Abeliophyllum distichum TaxID=126358 RepID=A0ABD1QTP3_9LAMI
MGDVHVELCRQKVSSQSIKPGTSWWTQCFFSICKTWDSMVDSGVLILAFPYASDFPMKPNRRTPCLLLGSQFLLGVAQKKAFFEAHYKRIAAQKVAALLEQANSVDEQKISGTKVHDHNEDVENVESNEVENDKVDQKAPVTEKEALIETPVKKISMNQLHNLENKDTVSGSETNDILKVDKCLLKVIEIDKKNSIAEREKQSITRKKRSSLSSLKSWFLCKTYKVPRLENKSHSKSLIARQNNLQSPQSAS